MKRALVLAILGLFVVAAMACADTATFTLKPGNNLIAASLVPYAPEPSSVFKTDTGASIAIANNLQKWDPFAAGGATFKAYTSFGASGWGKIMLGTGYFLKNTTGANLVWQYQGFPNGVPTGTTKTDMWISLPKAGQNCIGHPFTDQVTWANCLMTDGTVTVTVAVAKAAPYSWWSGDLQYWDPAAAGGATYKPVVLSGFGTTKLSGFYGYFLKTNVDNLALIVPANP